jgi:hypothetical protein
MMNRLNYEKEKAMFRSLQIIFAVVLLSVISACSIGVHPHRHVHHRHAHVKVWVPGHFNHHAVWIPGHWKRR